mmetsp:Transcript_39342/g.88068  ORF Transcript_39342/g.88068 Transcript_39342/m.88068 type:complete len:129 (-) Transcript_39342:210-596(-)
MLQSLLCATYELMPAQHERKANMEASNGKTAPTQAACFAPLATLALVVDVVGTGTMHAIGWQEVALQVELQASVPHGSIAAVVSSTIQSDMFIMSSWCMANLRDMPLDMFMSSSSSSSSSSSLSWSWL